MMLTIDISTVLVAALLGVLTIILWKKSQRRHSLLPPGPTPLPFIGNILHVKPKAFLQSLEKLRSTYGSVYTIYIGSRPIVMLCGYNVIKEAMIDYGESFINRGKMPLTDHILKGFGIIASNGERWKQLRRFSLMTLRNFGMGKRSLEERIQEETQYLVEKFRETKGVPFDPTFLLGCAVSNNICSILFSQRYDYTDKRFLSLLNNISSIHRFMNSTWGLLYFNFHKILCHFPGPHNQAMEHLRECRAFVEKRVSESQDSFDPDSPRHFIDCFLTKMKQDEGNPDTEFHMENLVVTALNLFFAGTETVSTTLRYGFLIFLKYHDIQGRIQGEIDHVIGCQRCPSVEDRNKMPYTEAVIYEIQRFSDIIPTGLPHATTHDVSFRGYLIPKDTDVFPLLTTVLKDPGQYPNPQEFCPGRFLDEEGNVKKSPAFMPFSTGKRICPGEGLARTELFLFITSILQNFTLTCNVPTEELDLNPYPTSSGHVPHPYLMSVIPRP
ncbi:cytochrome P450 2G1-like isoform 1-T1 [Discoglossus pictus]